MSQILNLEEERNKANIVHAHHQQLVKASFNVNSIKDNNFEIIDLVLKWDKVHEDKGKHMKFQKLSPGSFHIFEKICPSNFIFKYLQKEEGNSSC